MEITPQQKYPYKSVQQRLLEKDCLHSFIRKLNLIPSDSEEMNIHYYWHCLQRELVKSSILLIYTFLSESSPQQAKYV